MSYSVIYQRRKGREQNSIEGITFLRQKLENANEKMLLLQLENQSLTRENDKTKGMLNTYFEKIKEDRLLLGYSDQVKVNVHSTSQKLHCLFDYIDKLKATVHNQENELKRKSMEVTTTQKQLDFLCRENRSLIAFFDEVDQKNYMNKSQDCHNRTHPGQLTLERRTTEDHQNITLFKLDKQIQVYQKQQAEKDKIMQEQFREIQDLQEFLNKKDKELREALMKINKTEIVTQNRNKRLCESQQHIATITNSQAEIGEREEADFRKGLDSMSKIVNEFCKPYILTDIEEKTNSNTIGKTVKIIQKLQEEVEAYKEEISKLEGRRDDKRYLHIKEMLLRILAKLDSIDSQNKPEIIKKRKKTVALIKDMYSVLESKPIT